MTAPDVAGLTESWIADSVATNRRDHGLRAVHRTSSSGLRRRRVAPSSRLLERPLTPYRLPPGCRLVFSDDVGGHAATVLDVAGTEDNAARGAHDRAVLPMNGRPDQAEPRGDRKHGQGMETQIERR